MITRNPALAEPGYQLRAVEPLGDDGEGHAVYRITDAGRAEVTSWWSTPVSRTSPPRDELAIKLAMAVTVPGVDVRAVVQRQCTATVRALQDYTRPEAQAADGDRPADPAWLLVLDSLVFAAEADARPDFATMGAVGAGPRTRRLVASSYALAIGLVGAVLGAVVGAVPGIAVTYPLTSHRWLVGTTNAHGEAIPDHFLTVPWLLVGAVVVGLPLLSAAIVAVATRSRLPMVSRLS